MNVATTILNQLGGNKFIAMTGSKNFLSDKNMLIMSLTKNRIKAKNLRIELNSNDLYDMTFYKINRDFEMNIISKLEDVPADLLQRLFTQHTGLETRL